MNILIINGTKRQNNQSIKVVKYITKIASSLKNIKTTLIDVKDFKLFLDGHYENNDNEKYKSIVAKSDAFIVVSPEYNHSFPGALKTLLDSASKEYIYKPVLLVGVSSGPWGGTRVIESLVPVLRELGLVVSFADLMFPVVQEFFDESGNPKESNSDKRVLNVLTELKWLSKTLKYGRDNFENKLI